LIVVNAGFGVDRKANYSPGKGCNETIKGGEREEVGRPESTTSTGSIEVKSSPGITGTKLGSRVSSGATYFKNGLPQKHQNDCI